MKKQECFRTVSVDIYQDGKQYATILKSRFRTVSVDIYPLKD